MEDIRLWNFLVVGDSVYKDVTTDRLQGAPQSFPRSIVCALEDIGTEIFRSRPFLVLQSADEHFEDTSVY